MKVLKKISLLMLITLFLSCSVNDNLEEDCNCKKTTYFISNASTQYIQNTEYFIIKVEDVGCTEQLKNVRLSSNIYYSINCNKN